MQLQHSVFCSDIRLRIIYGLQLAATDGRYQHFFIQRKQLLTETRQVLLRHGGEDQSYDEAQFEAAVRDSAFLQLYFQLLDVQGRGSVEQDRASNEPSRRFHNHGEGLY